MCWYIQYSSSQCNQYRYIGTVIHGTVSISMTSSGMDSTVTTSMSSTGIYRLCKICYG